jgi:hypothetical protein
MEGLMSKPITLQPQKPHTMCIDFPPAASTALHELRALTGVPFADLIRASVQLLRELAVAQVSGGRVVRLDARGRPLKEFRLPSRELGTVPLRARGTGEHLSAEGRQDVQV